jgi:hypothetical protein
MLPQVILVVLFEHNGMSACRIHAKWYLQLFAALVLPVTGRICGLASSRLREDGGNVEGRR